MTINPIDQIRAEHRTRRFAMKGQQTLDRRLESFIRVNATEWAPDMEEADREKINKEVKALIKRIKTGVDSPMARYVHVTDQARAPYDELRDDAEKKMAKLAMELPVYAWVEKVRGAGALGLAIIVAEAGDLSSYSNPAKLWKRLGFAPYDGLAGSSWKRASWRPRALTAEEWVEFPFSGERYAQVHQIVVWLVNAQWTGKTKTESGEGEPNGPYGQVYAKRREHTKVTHPDWTDMHRRMDALRFTMKNFLKDLHAEWCARSGVKVEQPKPQRRTNGGRRTYKPKKSVRPHRRRSAPAKNAAALRRK